jgi:hypothetical protein
MLTNGALSKALRLHSGLSSKARYLSVTERERERERSRERKRGAGREIIVTVIVK